MRAHGTNRFPFSLTRLECGGKKTQRQKRRRVWQGETEKNDVARFVVSLVCLVLADLGTKAIHYALDRRKKERSGR